jgi:hypothetical protein
MTNYISYRTPDAGELWYNSTSSHYYVGNKAGRVMPLQFDFNHGHPSKLLKSIREVHLVGGRRSIGGVCDGQAGWIFVADNWLEYAKQTFHRTIESMSDILRECAIEVGTIHE